MILIFILQQEENPTDYDLTQLYAKTHKNRDGVWSNPEAEANYVSLSLFNFIV